MYFLVNQLFTRFFASSGPVHILGFAGSMTGPVLIPAPQVVAQIPSTQQSGSQVSGVTGPHSVGTGSPGSVVRPAGSSGTGDGSTITGTPYRGSGSGLRSGLQGTPVVGTPASGS